MNWEKVSKSLAETARHAEAAFDEVETDSPKQIQLGVIMTVLMSMAEALEEGIENDSP